MFKLLTLIITFTLSLSASAKTFVYCSEGSPSAFNPQITTDGTSNNASGHTVYDRLVDFKYGTTKVVPSLAKSWKVSKDRKTYTFKLRKGVKYHTTKYFTPTRDFNADDVIFSLNRQRLKDHPYHTVNGGHYEYWNAMDMGKLIKDIKKLDDYTLRIVLNQPEAPFLANMAMSFMSILSKEYADTLVKQNKKENIDNYPVGTGPYVYKKYKKDTLIRFTSNEKYFGGAPKVANLVFSITPDPSVRYQKLKTGECHLIIEPSPADVAAMKKNTKLTVLEGAGLNVGYLALNTQKKPFDNVNVRRAINMALNRQAYIDAIYLGNAKIAKNPLPPTIWSYNKGIKPFAYNVKKAKALLKKAGFPNGFETELWTLPVTRPYNPNGKKMGEMMQADLAKIGIKVKLISYDWPTYLSKSRNGEHSMIQLGWTGDNGDPDNFLNVLLGCTSVKAGSNVARWCDKKFNKLITDAKRITSTKQRTKLYQRAQKIFRSEVPWAPIAHSTIYRAMSKNVKGYKIDPLGGDIFSKVELK
ncbi:MAG: ABC transporter substrate-binding protein [Bacteriovoracaceae bacterium]|nr:ABC transporter substrate-binding protein [Bacteriovoracaceae bacterium]